MSRKERRSSNSGISFLEHLKEASEIQRTEKARREARSAMFGMEEIAEEQDEQVATGEDVGLDKVGADEENPAAEAGGKTVDGLESDDAVSEPIEGRGPIARVKEANKPVTAGQKPFLKPEQEPELVYSVPGERYDDNVTLDHPELAEIMRSVGIDMNSESSGE